MSTQRTADKIMLKALADASAFGKQSELSDMPIDHIADLARKIAEMIDGFSLNQGDKLTVASLTFSHIFHRHMPRRNWRSFLAAYPAMILETCRIFDRGAR